MLWLGLALVAISGTHEAGTSVMCKSTAVAMVSPVWSWFFLLLTSLMLLEKRTDKKFGRAREVAAS